MLRLEAAEDARSHDRASVWSRPPRYTQLFWDLAPSNPWLMIGPRPPAAHPSVSPPVPSKGRLAGWLAGWDAGGFLLRCLFLAVSCARSHVLAPPAFWVCCSWSLPLASCLLTPSACQHPHPHSHGLTPSEPDVRVWVCVDTVEQCGRVRLQLLKRRRGAAEPAAVLFGCCVYAGH